MSTFTRRTTLGLLSAGLAAPSLLRAQGQTRVVIVGAGFGGASTARALKALDASLEIIVIEKSEGITTCPFSNAVLGGLIEMEAITFGFDSLRQAGINVLQAEVTTFDPVSKTLSLHTGATLAYDMLVLSPGISFHYGAIAGYSETVAQSRMPHAWKAGPQTALLSAQIAAMPEGGTFAIAIPAPPFRCPPGPYERISLIAHRFTRDNPTAKILVLDAQDSFSKQPLFEEAWASLYPNMITRIPAAEAGTVIEVDAQSGRVSTAFDDFTPDVANIIPPQRAGQLILDTGLDGGLGWAPIDPITFESTLAADIFILGDAAVAGEMPKSAFSAHVQGMAVAQSLHAKLTGTPPPNAKLLNTCYSLTAPDYGISIAHVFERSQSISLVDREGRTTPLGASAQTHAAEARHAHSWYASLTGQLWG